MEKGVDQKSEESKFIINEEHDENGKEYFSISGERTVIYNWFRVGKFRTREEAEKKLKEV